MVPPLSVVLTVPAGTASDCRAKAFAPLRCSGLEPESGWAPPEGLAAAGGSKGHRDQRELQQTAHHDLETRRETLISRDSLAVGLTGLWGMPTKSGGDTDEFAEFCQLHVLFIGENTMLLRHRVHAAIRSSAPCIVVTDGSDAVYMLMERHEE